MTHDARKEVYKQLEEQKGRKHQIAVAIEEMSELTKELSKFLREDSYTNNKKICEELADVKVVTEQLERFFDPDNKLVPFVMDYKLERLKMFYLDTYTITKPSEITIINDKQYRTRDVIFGKLYMYTAETLRYDWQITTNPNVNFTILRFKNQDELLDQELFMSLCMRDLHFLPTRLSDNDWCEVVNKALRDLEIIDS